MILFAQEAFDQFDWNHSGTIPCSVSLWCRMNCDDGNHDNFDQDEEDNEYDHQYDINFTVVILICTVKSSHVSFPLILSQVKDVNLSIFCKSNRLPVTKLSPSVFVVFFICCFKTWGQCLKRNPMISKYLPKLNTFKSKDSLWLQWRLETWVTLILQFQHIGWIAKANTHRTIFQKIYKHFCT